MARCKSCSAPLRPDNLNCEYCGIRNDVDLAGRVDIRLVKPASDRLCPDCECPMPTIDLGINGRFYVERCGQCAGLFLDPGEIEDLMAHCVTHDRHINNRLLSNINRDRYQSRPIRYRKCPVCSAFMRRCNFGQRSGVVVDICNDHGIWLDAGELIHLLEWKKAGGEALNEGRHGQPHLARGSSAESRAEAILSAEKLKQAHQSRDRGQRPTRNDDLEGLIGSALSDLVNSIFR
jgi:Zn-finger nucleic acid-binding protein